MIALFRGLSAPAISRRTFFSDRDRCNGSLCASHGERILPRLFGGPHVRARTAAMSVDGKLLLLTWTRRRLPLTLSTFSAQGP